MCLTPKKVGSASDGLVVGCRHCARCRAIRVRDLVGRCLAEQVTSSRTVALTLTYRDGDDPFAVVLYYRHVQLMLKRLRKAGFSVRYICAGEYGTLKGRAHWHIVLFFQGEVPELPEMETRAEWEYWPHGFVFLQEAAAQGFHYLMKYTLKDGYQEAHVKNFALSKKPPLGHVFFQKMADDLIAARLPLHSPEYRFAHVKTSNGLSRSYWLQGRMLDIFCHAYYYGWQLKYLGEEPPMTDILLNWLSSEPYEPNDFALFKYFDEQGRYMCDRDRIASGDVPAHLVELREKREQRLGVGRDWGGQISFAGMPPVSVSTKGGSYFTVKKGDEEWHLTVNEKSVSVDAQLRHLGLLPELRKSIEIWLRQNTRPIAFNPRYLPSEGGPSVEFQTGLPLPSTVYWRKGKALPRASALRQLK